MEVESKNGEGRVFCLSSNFVVVIDADGITLSNQRRQACKSGWDYIEVQQFFTSADPSRGNVAGRNSTAPAHMIFCD